MRTLSRFALIGLIGGGTAACSSDASRLGDPFTNPFSSLTGEPSATGSLPDEAGAGDTMPAAPAIRTPRVQTQSLGAPTPAMTSRPMASAPAARVASAEPTGAVAGMNPAGLNPDAGRAMTPRQSPAPKLQFTPGPKVDRAGEAKREAEARRDAERKLAEARKAEAAARAAEAKLAETHKAEARKLAETEAKKHVRPGQTAKAADVKTAAKAEAKTEAKIDPKAEAAARAKAEAARKAESDAKLAKADAARKVAEAKAAEAAAKAAAKQTKEAAKEPEKAAAPVKVASAEPATTASVAVPASNESFRWPARGRVINGYGSSGNEGINIAVPEGTPVKAAEDGTVAYAGSDVKGYGKLVLVRHTNGYVSAYAHNGELDVRPGEKVKRGQTIAKSGATGNVTSPQLHFEIRKGATPVDPMPHLAGN